jgi:hypothetical protein
VDKVVYSDKIKEIPIETNTENHVEELITVKKVREVPTEKKVSKVTNYEEVVTEKTYYRDEFRQVPVEKVRSCFNGSANFLSICIMWSLLEATADAVLHVC